MCITCTSTPDNITSDGLKIVLVKNYTKATIQLYKNSTLASFEDEEGQRVVSSIEPGNKVEIIVVFGNGFIVKKTTVYLIYDELIREKMEQLETQEELAIVSDGDENECSVRGSSPQVELVDEKDIVFSGDDNEGIVRTSSPQVERMDVNGAGGAASCCGLVKYSFRQWITDFMCRLVQCWEEEEALSYIRRHLLGEDTKSLRLHDVFLSFRGEDTRASFTSHLYDSLQNDGIKVFMDDGLQRGDHIQFSINIAIEVSQIAVIVFSKNYANSRWCLDELVNIIQVRRTIGQVVLPVFYDVDPSEVRHQIGEFGKAFQSLLNRISKEEEDKSLKWRDCLHEAASIAGFVVLNSRNEREAINHIVEKVALLLDKTDLFVADNPVGIESRVQDTIQLLNIQPSDNVLILGIWGMGGTGKTTIAKAIYNKIGRNFQGRSFLANIRETWEQTAGQLSLQEQLLFDIFKKTTKIQSIESGKIILKDRLCHKRILLLLDDVNSLDQLKALCGSRKWFGSGSRIIITTRDKHVLRGNRADQVYIMKEMDVNESLELFSWQAFKRPSPREDLIGISINVVDYCCGLPLALEILGSYLFDRGVNEWNYVLDKLKRIPNDQVQKKLKISYDGLNDDTVKEIFLDIACFFIGMDRNDVIQILNGCGLFAEIGISVLVERSLVTVDNMNNLRMHDLLRDMGREIVREQSPKEPGERSRLWFNVDVLDVLSEQTGTQAVEGLALKFLKADVSRFSTKSFEKMNKLRLLQLAGVQLDGDFDYLSRKLRWLCWNGFPLTCIPTNLYRRNLVSMELENSNIKLVWKENQRMEKLKVLNLSHSHYLTQTPDFAYLPNLEKLVLADCPRLSEISHSIGDLKKILLISLEDCISLRSLPRSIYKLKTLKTLNISGCLMIDKLEEDLEQMESLTILMANKTSITSVPFSVVRSKSIGYISLCGHEGFSCDVFPSIIWSWMSPTNNLPSPFQTSNIMSSLVPLDVPHSSSHELSSISMYLPSLRSLWIECSSELQLSQDAAIILDALYATNSKEMEPTATASASQASNMVTSTSQVSKHSSKSLLIQIGMNGQVTNILKEIILQNLDVNGSGGCFLPGDSYPNWLTFSSEGSFVTFQVPRVEGRNLKTIITTRK
ncbi:disease resistance protein RPV1 [Trifolium repens]|nr:disease resistance protein RPV1 [Trifolium repens]